MSTLAAERSHTIEVSEEQRRQFREEGYFILERVIPEEQLEILRGEAQRFVDEVHAEMERQGTDMVGLNHRGRRYFISQQSRRSPLLRQFLYSDLMADICRATI